MNYIRKSVFFFLTLSLLSIGILSGCGGDGESNSSTVNGDETNISFSAQIQTIFDEHCTTCHNSSGQAGFLPLTSDVAYTSLVNETATQTGVGATRVIPFNSANSVLYQRVSGIGLPSVEEIMPLNGVLLPQEKRDRIKTWIDEGANNN